MSEFEGYLTDHEVQLGTIFGVRAFTILNNGKDKGMLGPASVSGYTWQPGENKANCNIAHRPAEQLCGCGFYGYYDGDNDYYRNGTDPDRMAGIIEAYGKCQVGDRGFRAEKAKIVALVVPGYTDKPHHSYPWCGVSKWMSEDPDREAYSGIWGLALGLCGIIFAVVCGFVDSVSRLWPIGLGMFWAGFIMFLLAAHSFSGHRSDAQTARLTKVAKNYPDAKIFPTEEKMRAAFDLRRPEPFRKHINKPTTASEYLKWRRNKQNYDD